MITKTKSKSKDISKYFAFETTVVSKEKMQSKLLKMASSGKKRPSSKSEEGKALIKFTRKSEKDYDLEFDENIRSTAPDWFVLGVKLSLKPNKLKRESTFLDKFKLLLVLIKNKNQIHSKDTLVNLYFDKPTSKSIHAQKVFISRIMNLFQSMNLVYSCDDSGNKIDIDKQMLNNKFLQRFWKVEKDIEQKLNLK